MQRSSLTRSLLGIPLVLLATTALAATTHAQGNSDKGTAAQDRGDGKSLVQNGRSALKGNLRTRQHIYYTGDELDISLQFARGHDLLAEGTAEAHVVVYSFDGSLMVVPVPAGIGSASRKFFRMDSVDISALPEGQYQLGLILTVPDGDPTLLEDWYGGYRALLDMEAVYISAKPLDSDDDGDGEHDDDEDGDGIDGEEEDEADDDGTMP